jgi:hypothetical protein
VVSGTVVPDRAGELGYFRRLDVARHVSDDVFTSDRQRLRCILNEGTV